MDSKYPNMSAVLYLCVSFFMLFMAFNSAANSAAKALKDEGFNNLGYYSLAVLYLGFAIGSMWAPRLIRYFKPRTAMAIASLTYALYIVSLALTSLLLLNETLRVFFGRNGIVTLVLAIAFICGPGPSLLWIA